MKHASPEDCPCCHDDIEPGDDTDRALVVAFVAGIAAAKTNTPVGTALCPKHTRFAAECAAFVGGALSPRTS